MSEVAQSLLRRPADTPFKQQRLRAWQPIFSPNWVMSCFFAIAGAFIPIGSLVIVASDKVEELEVRYDHLPSLRDCHWNRGAGGFNESCLAKGYQSPDCGMLSNLGSSCPRNWSKDGWEQMTLSDIAALNNRDAQGARTCDPKCTADVNFQVTETMESPVYMYYKLTNFYQNHRRYAKSRNDAQLAGDSVSGGAAGDCSPLRNPGEIGDDQWCLSTYGRDCSNIPTGKCNQMSGDSCTDFVHTGQTGDFIYAGCGLVAWSFFNDSFTLSKCTDDTYSTCDPFCIGEAFDRDTGEPLVTGQQCQKKEIAWAADRDKKFQSPSGGPNILSYQGFPATANCSGQSKCDFWMEEQSVLPYFMNGWYMFDPYHQVPSTLDEDFMVWMRTASLPTFRKLYRKINRNLEPGYYKLTVDHRFDTSSFDGEKSVVLSTLSWVGGKNYFLGGAYVAVGGVCFLLAVGFLIKHCFCRTDATAAMASYQQGNR